MNEFIASCWSLCRKSQKQSGKEERIIQKRKRKSKSCLHTFKNLNDGVAIAIADDAFNSFIDPSEIAKQPKKAMELIYLQLIMVLVNYA